MRLTPMLVARAALVACLALIVVPGLAAAHTPFLGEPQAALTLPAEALPLSGASNSVGGQALAFFEHRIGANVTEIAHRDADGRWRTFALPAPSRPAGAVRLVALEGGRFLAAWDAGNAIDVQEWDAAGTVGPVQTVLEAVGPVGEGDSEFAAWQLRADRSGTVVIAATGVAPRTPGGVYAAVRDPGGGFGPVQELSRAGETASPEQQIRIGPIAAGGSVTVQWDTGVLGIGTPGQAVRPGVGVPFGAPTPPSGSKLPAERIAAGVRTAQVLTDTSDVLDMGPPVTALCPCFDFRAFPLRRGGRFVVFAAGSNGSRAWYTVGHHRDGSLRAPVRISSHVEAPALQDGPRGLIAFGRSTAFTDYGLFRHTSDVFLERYGLFNDTHPPRLTIGPVAIAHKSVLLVPVWCDEPCVVSGTAGGDAPQALKLRTSLDKPRGAALESYDVAWLRLPSGPGAKTARVSAAARDTVGKFARAHARFVPSHGPRLYWCRAGATAPDFGCR